MYSSNNLLTVTLVSSPFSIPSEIYWSIQLSFFIVESKLITPAFLSIVKVGLKLAEKAKKKGIKEVLFDRSGYLYHGNIKSFAEGAREGGLIF